MQSHALNRKPRIPKEYLGAFKAGHRQRAREFIDEELSYKLLAKVLKDQSVDGRKALEFLTLFNNEYHKNVVDRKNPHQLHKTDAQVKDCSRRNNAQNRDIISRERNFVVSLEDEKISHDYRLNKSRDLSHEDHIIELIDHSRKFNTSKR